MGVFSPLLRQKPGFLTAEGSDGQKEVKMTEKWPFLTVSRGTPGKTENLSPMRGKFSGLFGGFFPKNGVFGGFGGYLSSKRKKPLHCAQLILSLFVYVAQCNGPRFEEANNRVCAEKRGPKVG